MPKLGFEMSASVFSPDYQSAKSRFCASATAISAKLEQYSIDKTGPNGENLTIDVAILGESHAKKVAVFSSGLHGVEGFFGSAVQSAFLEDCFDDWHPPLDTRVVLIHALNPYGFAWLRRANEDNVDLNRNFLLPGEEYRGSPEMYGVLNDFLNPTSPPSGILPFSIAALALIVRYGLSALKNTLPVGQYDYPEGLFFGGGQPSKTYRILEANLPRWIDNATDALHLDFHTGLGQSATYKLFLEGRMNRLAQAFGTDVVEEQTGSSGTAYPIRGGLGKWCGVKFPQCNYVFLTAEFGTYESIATLEALQRENYFHLWGKRGDRDFDRSKKRLREVFAPASQSWRNEVVSKGLALVQKAIQVVSVN